MKVQKYEISRTIDKLKSIVQKNDQFPALGGVLVKDGYLIASNTEMTMQLKLEASKGSCFIIPMKAFDVIKNLPDGEVIIDADGKNIVTIKTKAIKNKYQSYPPEEFSFDITEDLDAPEVVINGKRMMEAIGHVIYAAADSSSATQMMGVYFEGGENKIKLVALDGHVVAVDSKLVLETLKAFTCENIAMNFSGPKMPAVVEAEDSDMKAIVLPVMIREE